LFDRLELCCNEHPPPGAPDGTPGRRYKLYGDAGYAQSQYIDRPFSRVNMTAAQENYNALMSRVRVSVENAIGTITNVFAALDYSRTLRIGQSPVGAMFLVAVILRNFLTCVRRQNQISIFFGLEPPTLAEFARHRPDVHPRLQELADLVGGPDEG
jgi:hypothetical protein